MNAHGRAVPMHLKSCQIDGRLLRATESQECGPHLRQLRCGRERKLSQCEAGGRFEGVGKRGTAAFDAPDRRLDREGIRPRLRKPLGTDRAFASSGARVSQAGHHSAQARRREAEGWANFRDSVTDNFRVINPKDFRVLT
jgi:hypothetical protein